MKFSYKDYIMLVLLIAFFVFGCINQPPVANNQTNTSSNTSLNTSTSLLANVVELGDIVSVDYILKLDNGSIVDTSIASVANESGIFNPNRKYEPLTFQIGPKSGLVKGFTNAVIGMKVNETKEVAVKPEDGYGLYDPSKVYPMPLYYNQSKYEEVPKAYFDEDNITLEEDKVIFSDLGMVAIKNFTNETVTIMYIMSVGKKFTFNGIPQEVVNSTNSTLVIMLNFVEGKQYLIGPNGKQKLTRVLEINETDAVLDENHQLAGKVLHFTITLRSIVTH